MVQKVHGFLNKSGEGCGGPASFFTEPGRGANRGRIWVKGGVSGNERGPVPPRCGDRACGSASPGCADVAGRCLGMKWVRSRHRVPKDRLWIGDIRKVLRGRRCGGGTVPGGRRDHPVSFGLFSKGTVVGSACRRIGIIFPVVFDGSVNPPWRREVLARRVWRRLHSAPCPAWGGKQRWSAVWRLPCHRSGGWRGWKEPAHAA